MLLLWIFLLFGVQTVRTLFNFEYLGCYKSSTTESELSVLSSTEVDSPYACVEECRARYYMFAGLMAGQRCYCGSTYGRNGLSENCTMPCSNNVNSICGSYNAMSIYSTGQTGPSPPRRVEAFHEGPTTLLVTWQPPDIPNGNITAYNIIASVIETHASNPLPPVEIQIEGGSSNSTVIPNLHPGTKYNISLFAQNLKGISEPAITYGWTLLGPPDKPETPKILENNGSTIKIQLSKGSSENGPITFYQVIVVYFGVLPPFGSDIAYPSYNQATEDDLGYYVTAEFDASDFPKYETFVVGDGKNIGGYYNAPLRKRSVLPQIGLVLVSRNRYSVQYSYSNLTNSAYESKEASSEEHHTKRYLWFGILTVCVLIAIAIGMLYHVIMENRRSLTRCTEQQELALRGPLDEVDNVAYIPDDVPERIDYYRELEKQVWTMPSNFFYSESVPIRRGRFGDIYRGVSQTKEGTSVPVSVHHINDFTSRPSLRRKMLRDLDICVKANSMEYLAGLVGICETMEKLFVVIEMPPQSLKQRLLASRSGEIFPAENFMKIASAVAKALKYLEDKHIIHKNLCARTVGMCNDGTPKLMGLGLSLHAIEDFKYVRWMAIECFDYPKKQSQRTVVWAFGILLWEILTLGATPYAHIADEYNLERALHKGERLKKLDDVPDSVYEVMLSCWNADSQDRPTFDELTRLDSLTVLPITVTEEYIPSLELV